MSSKEDTIISQINLCYQKALLQYIEAIKPGGKSSNFVAAASTLKKGMEKDESLRNDFKVNKLYGYCCMKKHSNIEAENAYKICTQDKNYGCEGYIDLVKFYEETDQNDKILPTLEEAFNKYKNDPKYTYLIKAFYIECLFNSKDKEVMRKRGNILLELKNNFINIKDLYTKLQVIKAFIKLGGEKNLQNAEIFLRTIEPFEVDNAPDKIQALYFVTFGLFYKGNLKYDKAIAQIKTAKIIKPDYLYNNEEEILFYLSGDVEYFIHNCDRLHKKGGIGTCYTKSDYILNLYIASSFRSKKDMKNWEFYLNEYKKYYKQYEKSDEYKLEMVKYKQESETMNNNNFEECDNILQEIIDNNLTNAEAIGYRTELLCKNYENEKKNDMIKKYKYLLGLYYHRENRLKDRDTLKADCEKIESILISPNDVSMSVSLRTKLNQSIIMGGNSEQMNSVESIRSIQKSVNANSLVSIPQNNSNSSSKMKSLQDITNANATKTDYSKLNDEYQDLRKDKDKYLGEGGFSIVVKENIDDVDMAVKYFKLQGGIGTNSLSKKMTEKTEKQITEQISKLSGEIQILTRLFHPNIIKCYGFNYENKKRPKMLMEIALGGDLENLLIYNNKPYYPKSLPNDFKIKISREIAEGLHYLHNYKNLNNELEPIVHGDLKPKNILLNEKFILTKKYNSIQEYPSIKLTDFGISGKEGEDITGYTPRFTPPEVLSDQYKKSVSSDIYSFGMLLYEVFSQRIPYYNIKNIKTVNDSIIKGEKPQEPTVEELICPDYIKEIINGCLEYSPDDRPNIDSILNKFKSNEGNKSFIHNFKDLTNALNQLNNKDNIIYGIMKDLCNKIKEFHLNAQIQRKNNEYLDLRIENIKLKEPYDINSGTIPVVDIDFSLMVDKNTNLTQCYYPPPEYFNGKTELKSDYFPLGFALYELVTGEKPFGNLSFDLIKKNILLSYLPQMDNNYNRKLKSLYENLTQPLTFARFCDDDYYQMFHD